MALCKGRLLWPPLPVLIVIAAGAPAAAIGRLSYIEDIMSPYLGRKKEGFFSRTKNSKNSERRCVTAITKMPIAFGIAGNNDSSRHRSCRSKGRGSTAETGGLC